MTPREEMLLRMYDQMFNDIDRHIMIVWHSIGAIVGAFAVLALVEKEVISLSVAAAIFVMLAGWVVAHALDASYWYNRNLVIIANIERQFLKASDLNDVHYYFGKHRSSNRMLTHLRIQVLLASGLGAAILLYDFKESISPGLGAPLANFDFMRTAPYVATAIVLYVLGWLRADRNASYVEFMNNSPGIAVGPPPKSLVFGVGHGGRKRLLSWWWPSPQKGDGTAK